MLRLLVLLVAMVAVTSLTTARGSAAGLTLAADGQTSYTIVVDPSATVAEKHAADELAAFLKQITGATFPLRQTVITPPGPALLVGPGRVQAKLAPEVSFDNLKTDGLVIETVGDHIVFGGDRPRGTLYAVYTFLEDVIGCRWWSSKVSTIPSRPNLTVPARHLRYIPPLEYREPFWTDAFDGDWAVRNKSNGMRARLDAKRGGQVSYGGLFVHTFFPLVPPEKYFKDHPEWYSEIDGKRLGGDGEYVQLCVTNEELKAFITQQVLDHLRDHPEANIVSVSQSDAHNQCRCANCMKLEEEEGSAAGPMLYLVNYVAAEVAKVYPDVAIDTLAYQYTRTPPKHVRPLPNVIVRLCSIECDFAHPLTAESNRKFAADIEGWAKDCDRLYIWDYVTNFSHYIQPHPNLRVLGPNIKFFVNNSVRGIFEQGAYTSEGAEFAELKAWVLAKLLWNPELDGDKLVEEFVEGYYGAAAPYISQYIKLLHDESEAGNTYLTCFMPTQAGFLNLKFLGEAEKLFVKAEAAAQDDAALLQRVQVARLPLRYVWTCKWFELQDQAGREGIAWPGPDDYMDNARVFVDVAEAYGVTMISEGSLLRGFKQRTVDLDRITSPPPPGCENLPRDAYFDLQDVGFNLAREGVWSVLKSDDLASDHVAAWMPGDHHEWAAQYYLGGKVFAEGARYTAYAAIRVEKKGNVEAAFSAGIYDTDAMKSLGSIYINCPDIPDDQYHVYKLGTTAFTGKAYLWVAPPANPDNVKAVWVDRFWLVKEPE